MKAKAGMFEIRLHQNGPKYLLLITRSYLACKVLATAISIATMRRVNTLKLNSADGIINASGSDPSQWHQ